MAGAQEYAAPAFSRSSSLSISRSPDTASPIYPERAIRPLPKSRLKSKLSPEQVSTIVYPPDPPPRSPALNFTARENGAQHPATRMSNGDGASYHSHHEHRAVHNHCTCGEHGDSGDEEVEFDHPDYRYPAMTGGDGLQKAGDSMDQRLLGPNRSSTKPAPPGSTASSADGYESFENTSNKKKRKIPLSGVSTLHQSQLSAEMANMGISNGHHEGLLDESGGINGVSQGQHQHQNYGPHANSAAVNAGTGISGAGRGRYGRQDARTRRPLGSSTMNAINGYNPRVPSRSSDGKHGADAGIENTGGIISQAIKTAAEQGPLTPVGKGKENVSLLQSAASAGSSTTPKTQFTFTCESDSASKMVDHQAAAAAAYAAGTPTPARTGPPVGKGVHAQGTQTTPMRGHPPPQAATRPPPPPVSGNPPVGHHQQPQAPPPKPRPRRNPSKEYALQALNRKKQQQYQNWHTRPKVEDMWICEFCEYEDIYGAPPLAMIRRYEIKDRQERKKAAEKRRLLEKAKMKGRKNKKGAGKGGKNSNANHGTAPAAHGHAQNYDPNLPPPDGEEYYDEDDDYGDEYEPIGPDDHYPQDYYPPPVPAGTPAPPVGGGGGRSHI